MYATLGVAAATLLVVGGILVGPSVLQCSRDPGGFGACLRGKAADNGLITPDTSSEPPPTVGWMEAAANEFEPSASLPVELEASPADLLAENVTAESSEAVAVAVAPAMELGAATPVLGIEVTDVALVGPQGEIWAEPAMAEITATGIANLSQPETGALVAEAPSQALADNTVAPQPIVPAEDLTSAIEPPPSEPIPVELSAEPLPPPEPSEPQSSFEPPPSSLEPSSSSEPEPPASSEPAPVVVFNPQYPNVIVLPPPVEGDNSSFRSLQLR